MPYGEYLSHLPHLLLIYVSVSHWNAGHFGNCLEKLPRRVFACRRGWSSRSAPVQVQIRVYIRSYHRAYLRSTSPHTHLHPRYVHMNLSTPYIMNDRSLGTHLGWIVSGTFRGVFRWLPGSKEFSCRATDRRLRCRHRWRRAPGTLSHASPAPCLRLRPSQSAWVCVAHTDACGQISRQTEISCSNMIYR